MINGLTTPTAVVKRAWDRSPRWWRVEIIIPPETPLYDWAKRNRCLFFPLTNDGILQGIANWLENNARKKYHIGKFSVMFQNEQDAILFWLTLK